MAKFLLGLLVGGLLVFAALRLFEGRVEQASPDTQPLVRTAEGDAQNPSAEMVRLEGAPAREPEAEPAEVPALIVPEGVIVLASGEGAFLATGEVVAGAEAQDADLLCHEVWRGSGAVLGCRHGAAPATVPEGFRFRFLDRTDVLARIHDAPEALPAAALTMMADASSHLGFGFVKDAEGRTWKVWAEHATSEPVVLDRRVHLRREEVQAQPGGGQAVLPHVETLPSVPFDVEHLKRQIEQTGALPEMYPHIGKALLRPFLTVDPMPAALGLGTHQNVLFDEVLDGRIETRAHVGIAAMRGIGAGARVSLKHHSACLVEGDVEGDVTVDDHAFLYVRGNVLGTVKVGFHATLRVDGDVRGAVVLQHQARALLLGLIPGQLAFEGATHVRLHLDQRLTESDLELFPGPGENSHSTLFLPRSDLPDGVHEDKGMWPKVQVGGDAWSRLQR